MRGEERAVVVRVPGGVEGGGTDRRLEVGRSVGGSVGEAMAMGCYDWRLRGNGICPSRGRFAAGVHRRSPRNVAVGSRDALEVSRSLVLNVEEPDDVRVSRHSGEDVPFGQRCDLRVVVGEGALRSAKLPLALIAVFLSRGRRRRGGGKVRGEVTSEKDAGVPSLPKPKVLRRGQPHRRDPDGLVPRCRRVRRPA